MTTWCASSPAWGRSATALGITVVGAATLRATNSLMAISATIGREITWAGPG